MRLELGRQPKAWASSEIVLLAKDLVLGQFRSVCRVHS
jgi:hypothetical protein